MLLFLLTALWVYLYIIIPIFKISVPCMFRLTTGLYCPGCGMTRFVYSIFKLQLYQAFRYNAMPFVLSPIYAVYLILEKKGYKKQASAVTMFMLILTILYGIIRNIPEFSWLAPIKVY